MQFKQKAVTVALIGVGIVSASSPALAASVLDTGMQTAMTTGFTDLKDTIKDIITVAWPFLLATATLLAAPGLCS
jgi:hypothetical protein